uniref:Uncharacterized protein n=1 Tax=Megaselia scalaris TaxID=36166 RepID=T1H168_MEGSC
IAIKRCPFGDTSCIKDTINDLIANHHTGIPEMSLISLDPMFIKEFKVKPNKGSNLNLRSTFYNSEVRGIKDAKAYDVKGFGKDMTEKHSVSFKHPLVGLYGDYKADGQLSIIPLKAQGKGNVNLSKRNWFGLDFIV